MKSTASAPGKIILTGEYAVLFGYPGIAIPAPLRLDVAFQEDPESEELKIEWDEIKDDKRWTKYLQKIIQICEKQAEKSFTGTLEITNQLPLGKGLGSSTTLVIAVSKCLLGNECHNEALAIENEVNPGHSGIDFEVIWNEKPIYFKDHKIEQIELPSDIIKDAILIDTGKPNEMTSDLIAYITDLHSRDANIATALETIGNCTERLIDKDNFSTIIHDHQLAQLSLGIVPTETESLITKIEQQGGVAKVLGAGARTGGGGMVLALHPDKSKITKIVDDTDFNIIKI